MTREPADPLDAPGHPEAARPPAAPAANRRPSVEERAARRTTTQAGEERLRYDHLLSHLREGREVEARPSSPFALSLDVLHRNFWRVIAAVAIFLVIYLVALNVAGRIRETTIDTWTGPDAIVTSGQQQPACVTDGFTAPFATSPEFPTWIRYDGRLYGQTDAIWPMGERRDEPGLYPPTGYQLSGLELRHVETVAEGLAGEIVIVRRVPAPTGRIFRHAAACD